MFRVQAPVVVVFSTEARVAPGAQQHAAGLEMAHFQIVVAGVTLAVSSRLRKDGFIVIELGLGDPRQAARVIPAAQLRQAEALARSRHALASHAR